MTLPRGIVDVERGIFDLASMDQNMAQKMKVIACLKLPFGPY